MNFSHDVMQARIATVSGTVRQRLDQMLFQFEIGVQDFVTPVYVVTTMKCALEVVSSTKCNFAEGPKEYERFHYLSLLIRYEDFD